MSTVPEARVVSHNSADDVVEEAPMTEKNYRRLLRQASSYASFQLPHVQERTKSLFKTGKPVFCQMLLVICGVLMVVEIAVNEWKFEPMSENPTLGPSSKTLLALGAKRTDLILDGEWYRLVAPIFLHGGLIHLLFNSLGIVSIGFPLEREYGSLKVAYVFLISGLMGVVISAIFSPKSVGIGASGGIFGLFGSAIAEFIMNFSLYKGQQCRTFTQLLFATVFNLMLGLVPFLDNFAHIGGFMTGFVAGLGVLVSDRYTRYGERKERKKYQIALQIISVLILPILLITSLFILFLGVDGTDWCPGCNYLSCVPFPPGDNPWWTCDPCVDGGTELNVAPNGTAFYTCPDGATQSADVGAGTQATYDLAIELCQSFCP